MRVPLEIAEIIRRHNYDPFTEIWKSKRGSLSHVHKYMQVLPMDWKILKFAVITNDLKMALLVRNHVDVKEAFREACAYGSLEMVKILMKGSDKKMKVSGFNIACGYGQTEIVILLGGYLRKSEVANLYVISDLCQRNRSKILLFLIKTYGVCEEDKDWYVNGFSHACMRNNYEVVKVLIDNLYPALRYAVHFQLEQGCDPARNKIYKILLERSEKDLKFYARDMLANLCKFKNAEMISILVDFCEKNNYKLAYIEETLEAALRSNCFNIVKILIPKCGPFAPILNHAFYRACEKGFYEIAKELVGIINLNTIAHEPVLEILCERGYTDILKVFMTNMSAIDILKNHYKCLHKARLHGRTEILDELAKKVIGCLFD